MEKTTLNPMSKEDMAYLRREYEAGNVKFTEDHIAGWYHNDKKYHYFSVKSASKAVCGVSFTATRQINTGDWMPLCHSCIAYCKKHKLLTGWLFTNGSRKFHIEFDFEGDLGLLMHHLLTLGDQYWQIKDGEAGISITPLIEREVKDE